MIASLCAYPYDKGMQELINEIEHVIIPQHCQPVLGALQSFQVPFNFFQAYLYGNMIKTM